MLELTLDAVHEGRDERHELEGCEHVVPVHAVHDGVHSLLKTGGPRGHHDLGPQVLGIASLEPAGVLADV